MISFFVLLCVFSFSLHAEVLTIGWWWLTEGEWGGPCPFYELLLLKMTPRLTLTLWRGGSMGFLTMTWPLLNGCLFASEKITHLVLFGPCQRRHFRAECGDGPSTKHWNAIKKSWTGSSHPAPFCPFFRPSNTWYFSSFLQHLLTSGLFFSAPSSPYFSASFSYNAAKRSGPSCHAVQK